MNIRKTSNFLIIFLLWGGTLLAQPIEEVGPVTGSPISNTSAVKFKKKTTTSVSLPFFDDFSYDQNIPDTSLWSDNNVYVNRTYGTAPPTLGVATFDGLDKDGIAYNLASLNTDSSDVLTSREIDLSNPIDSVYLSFFWQAGGRGEQPDLADSLTLRFYSPQTQEWRSVWRVSGVDSTGFSQVMIPITSSQYLRDGFRFMFTSFGASAGAFDTWNLDYVRLSDQRTFDDTDFTDPSFTRPHPSVLRSFYSVPWFHYDVIAGFDRKSTVFLHYQRNTKPPTGLNLNLCVYQISSGGNVLASNAAGDPTKDNSHNDGVETLFDCAIDPFNVPSPTDEFEIEALQTYTGINPADKGPNDTAFIRQSFKNYYALDDGSAERSYMVRDNRGGFIINKFDVAQADSLMGLYIYFLPSEHDIEQNEFNIVIYENDNNLPGNLIYESDSFYVPRYTSTDFYLPYELDKNIWVTGPVLIGIKQKSNVRLPIGLDVNTDNPTRTYYGTLTNLREKFVKGVVMMRPYFRYRPKDISVAEVDIPSIEMEFYPNPASDRIHVQRAGDDNVQLNFSIISLSGQLMQTGTLTEDIYLHPRINSGVYLIQVEDRSGRRAPLVKKIVVDR